MILPEVEIIDAHDILNSEDIDIFSPAATGSARRRFDLNTRWERGGFAPSLFADSNARSFAWLGTALREGMPALPMIGTHSLDPGPVWTRLAAENAREVHGVQKRSGLKKPDFNRVVGLAVQHRVLQHLPCWAPPGDNGIQSGKLYWTDSGMLHVALGLDPSRFAGNIAGLTDTEIKSLPTQMQNSWEGFVVTSLIRCAGNRAYASVWRGPDGEIDLILDWGAANETWAIEVTMGQSKKITSLRLGADITQASRAIVVHGKAHGSIQIKGLRDHAVGIECLTLLQALRQVTSGP